MAIVLGNFEKAKELKAIEAASNLKAKKDRLIALIGTAEPQVNLAKDIYDTYSHIKKIDEEFAKKLWKLLCNYMDSKIDINSYFSWGAGIGSRVHLSKNGVCIMGGEAQKMMCVRYGVTEPDIYRGKVLLEDFIRDFDVTESQLDTYIKELEQLICHFEAYAKAFFESVSRYEVSAI